MKQKMVIKVSMPRDPVQSHGGGGQSTWYGRDESGVLSVAIAGDARDRLEVVGDGVDPVCLVSRLRKKVGRTHILLVEEMKETKKKPEEEEKKKPEEPKAPPVVVNPLLLSCPGYHYPQPPVIFCEEPSNNCSIM